MNKKYCLFNGSSEYFPGSDAPHMAFCITQEGIDEDKIIAEAYWDTFIGDYLPEHLSFEYCFAKGWIQVDSEAVYIGDLPNEGLETLFGDTTTCYYTTFYLMD